MKRLLTLIFVVMMTFCANAQLRIGYATRDCEAGRKGDEVYYKPQKNGKITYIDMSDKAWYEEPNPIPAYYVEFSGYYIGFTKGEGVVNIRKGPGTNYPIVKKYGLDGYGDYVTFKYTNSNWLKVYEDDEAAMEKSWKIKSCTHKDYRKLVFIGYIHKNMVVDFPYNGSSYWDKVWENYEDISVEPVQEAAPEAAVEEAADKAVW